MPEDKRRPGRATQGGTHNKMRNGNGIGASLQQSADTERCWRCGAPFTRTDGTVLARCARLAREAELLALSDERDRWMTRVLTSWREGYAAGRADALSDARAAADEQWRAAWDPEEIERWKQISIRPDHSELDARRYPPLGRSAWLARAVTGAGA